MAMESARFMNILLEATWPA
jgi:hypothetical protein